MSTTKTLARLARIDSDIESLRARLEVKLGEREAILAELIAEGEAIRMAISPEPVAPAAENLRIASLPRLTEDQVREIRALYKTGLSQGAIARRFGLSQPSVHAIVRRRSYKDVA